METERWTMVELVARVAAALDGATYAGAPNGRVRDVPDARAVRWYSTIGLVDRPAAMRGRTALYGPRHLLQLVAVKRRQAEGRSIAEIQAELAGAPDETLREIAGIEIAGVEVAALSEMSGDAVPAPAPAARPRFWAVPAPAAGPDEVPVNAADPGPVFGAGGGLDGAPAPEGEGAAARGLLTGVPLGGGAFLLLPSAPRQSDLDAVAAAAAPLIDVLVRRGLLVAFDPDHPDITPSNHHATSSVQTSPGEGA